PCSRTDEGWKALPRPAARRDARPALLAAPASGAGLARIAAEIRGGNVLPRIDDGAADGARPREEREKSLAVAPADHALHGREIFREAAEHFEDRVLVVEADIAPHGRIGGGKAREITKA